MRDLLLDRHSAASPMPGGLVETLLNAKASLVRHGYLPNSDGFYHYVYSKDELKRIKTEIGHYPGSTLNLNNIPHDGIFVIAGIKMLPKLAGYSRNGFYIDQQSAGKALEINDAAGFNAQIVDPRPGIRQFFIDLIRKAKGEGK